MERFLGNSHSGRSCLPTTFLSSHLQIAENFLLQHSRPRPVFVGKALPQWRDDALFLRAAVKFQPRSRVFPNLPSPFDLQLFSQDLFDTGGFEARGCPLVLGQRAWCCHGAQRPANLLPPPVAVGSAAQIFASACRRVCPASKAASRLV